MDLKVYSVQIEEEGEPDNYSGITFLIWGEEEALILPFCLPKYRTKEKKREDCRERKKIKRKEFSVRNLLFFALRDSRKRLKGCVDEIKRSKLSVRYFYKSAQADLTNCFGGFSFFSAQTLLNRDFFSGLQKQVFLILILYIF